jgi:hypothetical protein
MSGFIIEEDRGTTRSSTTSPHPHNGYSGGDFSGPPDPASLMRWSAWGRAESTRLSAPSSR